MMQNHFQRRRSKPPGTRSGFTLIELMVTIAVFAILVAIGVPQLNDSMLGWRLTSIANRLVATSAVARGEAIKRNANVTMCVSTNGTDCAAGGWEQGWIVLAGTEVIRRETAAPTGIRISEGSATPLSSLTFSPSGVGATPAVLTVCRATPTAGPTERVIRISATGRANAEKTTNGVCS